VLLVTLRSPEKGGGLDHKASRDELENSNSERNGKDPAPEGRRRQIDPYDLGEHDANDDGQLGQNACKKHK